jgi:NitT/TauT family transport system permease protein
MSDVPHGTGAAQRPTGGGPPVGPAPEAGEPAPRPPGFFERWSAVILPALLIAALLIAWQLVTSLTSLFEPYILPKPSDIVARIVDSPGLLWTATRVTLVETLVGFVIGVALGVALAIPITYSKIARNALYPLIVASQAVPKVAIAPLLVVWLGLGITPKLAVVALMVFFPVVVTAAEGFSSVDRNLLDLLRSVHAGEWQIFRRVRLPHALPQLFSGLKIGITLAVVGAVVGEWVGADAGLGYLILHANSLLDTTLLYAALTVLVAMGVVLFILVEVAERLLLPWRDTAGSGSDAASRRAAAHGT